jgi:hypothetical protein
LETTQLTSKLTILQAFLPKEDFFKYFSIILINVPDTEYKEQMGGGVQ